MADIKTEISRFDYVKDAAGKWDWAVEVRVYLDDPHAEGGVRPISHGPMPPALAEEKFGVKLSDVIDGISADIVTSLDEARTNFKTARRDWEEERDAHEQLKLHVQATEKTVDGLREGLKDEQDAHAATRDVLEREHARLIALQDAVLNSVAAQIPAPAEEEAPAPRRRRKK